jgi:DNA polymerase III subunit epsilon
MARRLSGLPRRQRLIGLWLLLSGISIFGGATFALWLDSLFHPEGLAAWCSGWAASPAAAPSSWSACC